MNRLSALLALALATLPFSARADYPEKPIRIIVPFVAGGVSDILARIAATRISEQTGKALVVENRGGAGGRIGYEAGAKAAPDGYTLVATDVTYTMMPALYATLNWDHAALAPIAMIGQMPFAVTMKAGGRQSTMAEFLAYARTNPGKATYGSSGIGAVNHVVTELFLRTAGVTATHIPYKGMGEAIGGLLGGSIDFIVTALPTAMNHIRSGKAIALGVSAPRRVGFLPDLPTTTESGVAFVASNWVTFTTPRGAPREAFEWVQKHTTAAVSTPEVRERIAATGTEPQTMSIDEVSRFMQEETRRWAEVIRGAGIKAE